MSSPRALCRPSQTAPRVPRAGLEDTAECGHLASRPGTRRGARRSTRGPVYVPVSRPHLRSGPSPASAEAIPGRSGSLWADRAGTVRGILIKWQSSFPGDQIRGRDDCSLGPAPHLNNRSSTALSPRTRATHGLGQSRAASRLRCRHARSGAYLGQVNCSLSGTTIRVSRSI